PASAPHSTKLLTAHFHTLRMIEFLLSKRTLRHHPGATPHTYVRWTPSVENSEQEVSGNYADRRGAEWSQQAERPGHDLNFCRRELCRTWFCRFGRRFRGGCLVDFGHRNPLMIVDGEQHVTVETMPAM